LTRTNKSLSFRDIKHQSCGKTDTHRHVATDNKGGLKFAVREPISWAPHPCVNGKQMQNGELIKLPHTPCSQSQNPWSDRQNIFHRWLRRRD